MDDESSPSKKYFISPDILKGAKLYPTDDPRSVFGVGKKKL